MANKMYKEPLTIRMKDLKEGDSFIHQGGRWKVLEVNGKVLVRQITSSFKMAGKKEFPLAHAKVELIEQ